LQAFVIGDGKRKFLWITKHEFLDVEDDENPFDWIYDDPCYIGAAFQETNCQEQNLWTHVGSDFDMFQDTLLSTGACHVCWRAIMTIKSVKLRLTSNGFGGLRLRRVPFQGRTLSCSYDTAENRS
jgi:hypothetical protein